MLIAMVTVEAMKWLSPTAARVQAMWTEISAPRTWYFAAGDHLYGPYNLNPM
jgi:hypothetical protein